MDCVVAIFTSRHKRTQDLVKHQSNSFSDIDNAENGFYQNSNPVDQFVIGENKVKGTYQNMGLVACACFVTGLPTCP